MSQKKIKSVQTFIQNDLALVDFDYADSTGRYLSSIKEYDVNGNILKEIGYRPDGWIENHYSIAYNEKNQRVEYAIYDEDDQLLENHTFEYDDDGNIIGESCFYAEMDDHDYTHYNYDENGLLIEKRNLDSDNEFYGLIRFTYSNKLLVREEHINDEQKLESEKIFEYNAEMKLITETAIDHLEGDKRTIRNEYNTAGQKIKSLIYNKKDQLASKLYYEFDDQGRNCTLIEEDAHGVSITRYIYLDNGKMSRQEKYNANDELLVRWEYEYAEDLLLNTVTFIREESSDEDSDEDFEMIKRVTTENMYEFF